MNIHTFDTDIGRYYQVGDNAYPSVSTIIANTKSPKEKAILSNWRKRVGYKQANIITQSACSRGSLLHKCVEHLINGDLSNFNNLGSNEAIVDFIKPSLKVFAHISKCQSLGTEEVVYNTDLGYAGRFDYYAHSPSGKKVLIDWKTSSQKKPLEYCNNYFLQLTAYSLALKKMRGNSPDELAVIVFYENTPADVYRVSVQDNQYVTYQEEFIDRLAKFNQLTMSAKLETKIP